ncbi:hypothetical protein [Derxia lacustris]|uniref:hypothetical protein n=1 Tax=Derxia lacustris TaxID=764842 RepID=UPI000A171090|nr:hypothetical protein [Derxia lacustris]
MYWIYVICFGLSIAKWADVDWLRNLSWWWLTLPLIASIAWFEVLEREFGFDKQRELQDAEYERSRRERIERGVGRRRR